MGKVKRELFEQNPETLLPDDFDEWMGNLNVPEVDIPYEETNEEDCEGCKI